MITRRSFLVGSASLPLSAWGLSHAQTATPIAAESVGSLSQHHEVIQEESKAACCRIRSWDQVDSATDKVVYLSFSSSWKFDWN